jgi:hypothetical protein
VYKYAVLLNALGECSPGLLLVGCCVAQWKVWTRRQRVMR